MKRLDDILGDLLFGLLALILLGAPWLFAAWEMWWFWSFVVCLFLATGCLGVRCMLSVRLGGQHLGLSKSVGVIALLYLPFLAYALVRAIQADVHMDAERSFLLHFTPFLLGLAVIMGLTRAHQRLLVNVLAANFLLLGLYGIANYYLTGNAKVLWVPGFPQYQDGYSRATGSYFCPDHFAGLMELGLALAVGAMLAPSTSWFRRLGFMPVAAVALWGIVLSKSRGGGLITGTMLICALWWGTAAWSRRSRWLGRGVGLAGLALVLTLFALLGSAYVERFKAYPWATLEHWDRYQMSAATLRGWHSAPVWGIGPGMHQNLWPHFAPSADGDREKGIWPRFPNNHFHSFESHNDWFQLLEEYGVVGLALFLAAAGGVAVLLFREWRRRAQAQARASASASAEGRAGSSSDGVILGALLALTAMAGHSFGDFNLQMPATTWLLAALVGLAVASLARAERHDSRERHHP